MDPRLPPRNFCSLFGLLASKATQRQCCFSKQVIHSLNKPLLSASVELLGARHPTEAGTAPAARLASGAVSLTIPVLGPPGETLMVTPPSSLLGPLSLRKLFSCLN